ncbi:MAG TPA: cyclopropane-fatty-acyl-phospholipid synthase family protein [Gemmataceae bacterium]|nr:cyclopropane-fatty-acyl-phospholipid synthase family protein [Gemmataceae bacterium]
MLKQRLRQTCNSSTQEFAAWLRQQPVVIATDLANSQHYEVPADFFRAVLGPRLKYSCCMFENGAQSLAQAEDAMLDLTCERAGIADGMNILELGCGWGSLTLWIAEHYPNCNLTAVSNSRSQKQFMEARCRERGVRNIEVVTANVAEFWAPGRYDRIVSVEMFEHMRNYERLLERVASWLLPGGKLFVHIFCHRALAYPFEIDGDGDWMARHFFTGGIMPSFHLFDQFDRDFKVRQRWFIDGRHYARTCEMWLRNLDARRSELNSLFSQGMGKTKASVVLQRWRIFLMACAELFAFGGGEQWGVGHYLFEPVHRFARADLMESIR